MSVLIWICVPNRIPPTTMMVPMNYWVSRVGIALLIRSRSRRSSWYDSKAGLLRQDPIAGIRDGLNGIPRAGEIKNAVIGDSLYGVVRMTSCSLSTSVRRNGIGRSTNVESLPTTRHNSVFTDCPSLPRLNTCFDVSSPIVATCMDDESPFPVETTVSTPGRGPFH